MTIDFSKPAGKEQRDHGTQVRPVSLPVSHTDIAIQTPGLSSADSLDAYNDADRLTMSDNEDPELVALEQQDASELEWHVDGDKRRLLVPLGARRRPSGDRRAPGGSSNHFRRRRSVSLNDILGSSFVHESPVTGERIIISRGWPVNARPGSRRKGRRKIHSSRPTLDESHKRRLLMEFLQRAPASAGTTVRLGDELELESALKIRRVQPTRPRSSEGRGADASGGQARPLKRLDGSRALQVQYELPAHRNQIIELPAAN